MKLVLKGIVAEAFQENKGNEQSEFGIKGEAIVISNERTIYEKGYFTIPTSNDFHREIVKSLGQIIQITIETTP